jgi:hypothetical protein
MNNAVWLLLAVPHWYFSTIGHPLSAGPLSAIAAVGSICFVIGVILGFIRREPQLLLFLIPFVLSELFVAIAGALRGQLKDVSSHFPEILFIVVQIILVAYLIYHVSRARLAAVALAVFSVTFALFATLVAAMALSDTWI